MSNAQNGRSEKSQSSSRFFSFGYVLFLLLVLGVGTVFGWLGRSKNFGSLALGLLKPPEEAFGGKKSVVLLLLGCDEDRFYRGTKLHGSNISRQYARSDMILLTKLDFVNHKIRALSIPRDTLFAFPHQAAHKINWYFANAPFSTDSDVPVLLQRAALTQKVVESLLPGVHIDQSVVLNFEAFEALVDLVGGVDVNVEKSMNYDDVAGELHIHLKPGDQLLNGRDAMGYVRFRHDAMSDFARQDRQKKFMLAFKQAVIKNWARFPEIVDGGKQVFNGSLNNDQIASLFGFSKNVPAAQIQMGMVPVIEKGPQILLDKPKAKLAIQKFGFVGG